MISTRTSGSGAAGTASANEAGLAEKKCVPCEGGVAALSRAEAEKLKASLHADWKLSDDAKQIRRELAFKNFYRTMSFVNAIAHIANLEDHHPDLEVGYNYCRVIFTTHAIKGLSQNDFICAAKIDRVPTA
jgi:4a-hydroxytetrahydrobiopterin dehydratase